MTSVTFTLDLLRYEFFPKVALLDLIRFKSVCTLWCKEIEGILEHHWTGLLNDTESDPNQVGPDPHTTLNHLYLAAKSVDEAYNNNFLPAGETQKAPQCFRGLFNICGLKWNDSLCQLTKNYSAIGFRVKIITLFPNPPNFEGIKLAFAQGTNSLIGFLSLSGEDLNIFEYNWVHNPDRLSLAKYYIKPTWLGFGKPATYDRNNQLVDISFDIKTFEEVFGSKAENSQTCCGCLG